MFSLLKKLLPEPLKNVYHLLQALFGALIFGFPTRKLKVIGITGTDGKTTTCYLVNHILNKGGKRSSMISTVEAKIGMERIETGLHVTTPNPISVQRLLAKMAKAKSEYAVLEATSHGLAQERVAFVNFFIGLVTNVTHEHFDYHKTHRNYLAAKSKILKGVTYRFLNVDDRSYESLKDQGSGQLVTFGLKNEADFVAKNIRRDSNLLQFDIESLGKKDQKISIKSNLIGEFNVYNILAATAVCRTLGVDQASIASAIEDFKGVPGRMQFIDEGQDFSVVVDFAHTPASLEAALKSLNKIKKGKIIAIFGCAGERDSEKRPVMGKIATQLADYCIFTSEDPRREDVNQIIEQMAKGALSAGAIPNQTFWKIPDRTEAINTAIQRLATGSDIVAIFGKGPEKSMNIKGKEIPWSDEQTAHTGLKERLKKRLSL
ncbi:MAG: hypothetical protein A2172_00265 [Candidatus Woykebacteria bacterium RBG_13_40_15]|uniref:UDP-N-acetylmuramyl-tripeptide synthetase n=1 Tax=Candidatus Woykebacteria bacterium RBG_13_40_15 TaxID=1802593 RepID=A0A1G1W9S4_9BACT|nr:MAG: hypothetical protein A2172_00265 [Candidatus Woykebacteria bacterium RBG_13_40_15]